MAQYRIICTNQEPASQPNDRAHIVAVGTGDESGYNAYWSLNQVLSAMDQGHRFSYLRTNVRKNSSCSQVCLSELFQNTYPISARCGDG